MFSVVIPVFNHEKYLHDAVMSALQSRLVNEVLLVDDGSKDRSPEIITALAKQHPNRIRDLTPMSSGNKGAHVRLNQLCEVAKNEWIAVLNSDDVFVPGRFEVIQALGRTTKADMICGSLAIINEDGSIIGGKKGLLDPEYSHPSSIDPNMLDDPQHMLAALCNQNIIATTSNMTFRKSLFHMVGGFADLRYTHDWNFALLAALVGKVHISSSYLTKYRIHGSNTIKERSGHIDGEIRRFFYKLLADYMQIEASPLCRDGLVGNQHLAPYVKQNQIAIREMETVPFSFNWSRSKEFYRVKSRHLSKHPFAELGEHAYVLSSRDGLNFRALENSVAAIQHNDYDFVILSHALEESPVVTINSDGSFDCIFNAAAASLFLEGSAYGKKLRGRIVRNALKENWPHLTDDLSKIPAFQPASIDGPEITFGDRPHNRSAHKIVFPETSDGTGPLILVLPIFLAVGGVERNTIEVIRALRHRYRFLVITTERQLPHQGSLHYQLDELNIPTLDLAEIADRSDHVSIMHSINDAYKPDAVWICNGSPWLADNAERIRRIFSHTPIVDQQVYDTEYGWINRYNDPGIQSFDHFIAINQRIKAKFISEIRIPPHRVSLIYSAINTSKLSRPLASPDEFNNLRINLGLSPDSKCFAFIGRLTSQKRPLHFLEIARASAASGHDDQFLLVGDGELGVDCDRFISDNSLSNVRRIKYYDDSWAMMNVIDGLIITSAFEGLPIVLLEALSFGRPALSTDVGDVKIVLQEYAAGCIYDAGATTTEAWEEFLVWRGNLERYTDGARRHRVDILDRFSSRAIARQYADIFDRLIKS